MLKMPWYEFSNKTCFFGYLVDFISKMLVRSSDLQDLFEGLCFIMVRIFLALWNLTMSHSRLVLPNSTRDAVWSAVE